MYYGIGEILCHFFGRDKVKFVRIEERVDAMPVRIRPCPPRFIERVCSIISSLGTYSLKYLFFAKERDRGSRDNISSSLTVTQASWGIHHKVLGMRDDTHFTSNQNPKSEVCLGTEIQHASQ